MFTTVALVALSCPLNDETFAGGVTVTGHECPTKAIVVRFNYGLQEGSAGKTAVNKQ